ncbi:hypothetical protein SHIRM173S_09234 [Streptomyces hirsutus]
MLKDVSLRSPHRLMTVADASARSTGTPASLRAPATSPISGPQRHDRAATFGM